MVIRCNFFLNLFIYLKFSSIFFKDLASNFWCKEVKIIKINSEAKLFEIIFQLKSSHTDEILKWSYSFSTDNILNYNPVK